MRLVPAACDDHTAEQTAAGGSWALGVCVRKAVARNNSHTNAFPEISSVSPPFFRTKTRLAKEKYEMISNVQKGTTVGGPGTPPFWRTREEFCTVWNSAR